MSVTGNIDSGGDCEESCASRSDWIIAGIGHGRPVLNSRWTRTHCIRSRPGKFDSLIQMNNSMSNVLNVRNAIIMDDATHAIKTMLSRKSPDLYMIHFFPVESVQIAMNHSWTGPYRAVAG